MPGQTYAVRFTLVDPTKLATTSSIEPSIVMTIGGLVQGHSSNLDSLNVRDGSRLLNRNIARLSHRKGDRATYEKTATEAGTMILYYCSRCGRKFKTNDRCQKCNIGFTLSSIVEGVVGSFPGIPARVVAYAKQHGHAFTHEPPRA
jgi:hypothetical protein